MLDDSGASVLVHSADTVALVAAAAPLPPTGFGSARFLAGHGITCQVSARSKLQRDAAHRVAHGRGPQAGPT